MTDDVRALACVNRIARNDFMPEVQACAVVVGIEIHQAVQSDRQHFVTVIAPLPLGFKLLFIKNLTPKIQAAVKSLIGNPISEVVGPYWVPAGLVYSRALNVDGYALGRKPRSRNQDGLARLGAEGIVLPSKDLLPLRRSFSFRHLFFRRVYINSVSFVTLSLLRDGAFLMAKTAAKRAPASRETRNMQIFIRTEVI